MLKEIVNAGCSRGVEEVRDCWELGKLEVKKDEREP